MTWLGRSARTIFLWDFVSSFFLALRYFFAPKKTLNYPFEKGAAVPALPRRACAAPLSIRRGTLHRLQAVRGHLPGAGHHHRGRTARGRQPAHHALRHRHGQMHLLRAVPGGLPGRCHRRRPEFRVLPPKPAKSFITTRPNCSRTATAGSGRSPRIWSWTHLTASQFTLILRQTEDEFSFHLTPHAELVEA